MIPRFLDSWVVERTLFEFTNSGGCSCCGMQHGGMRAQDFMKMCSDYETDDAKKEVKSVWPDFMRDDVWSERVKFRRLLKEGLPTYRERFAHASKSAADFESWFRRLDVKERAQCFQMPKEELKILLNQTYGFKSAYQVVLCAVVEQVERYQDTGYTNDGATDAEVTFDECLFVDRGAFVLEPEYYTADDGVDMLLERFRELGGDHLLAKRDEERRLASLEDGPDEVKEDTQTFRSDRRLIRVCIARYFADVCWRKFVRTKGV